jgi:hypothetical protein
MQLLFLAGPPLPRQPLRRKLRIGVLSASGSEALRQDLALHFLGVPSALQAHLSAPPKEPPASKAQHVTSMSRMVLDGAKVAGAGVAGAVVGMGVTLPLCEAEGQAEAEGLREALALGVPLGLVVVLGEGEALDVCV